MKIAGFLTAVTLTANAVLALPATSKIHPIESVDGTVLPKEKGPIFKYPLRVPRELIATRPGEHASDHGPKVPRHEEREDHVRDKTLQPTNSISDLIDVLPSQLAEVLALPAVEIVKYVLEHHNKDHEAREGISRNIIIPAPPITMADKAKYCLATPNATAWMKCGEILEKYHAEERRQEHDMQFWFGSVWTRYSMAKYCLVTPSAPEWMNCKEILKQHRAEQQQRGHEKREYMPNGPAVSDALEKACRSAQDKAPTWCTGIPDERLE